VAAAGRICVEIFLGDSIDRGPASKDVIDLLAARIGRNHSICLRGNYEELMETFLQNPRALASWLRLGSLEAPISYGVVSRSDAAGSVADIHRRFCRAFPKAHQVFMQGLKPWICCGEYLFVHAGIMPEVPLDQQAMSDLLDPRRVPQFFFATL
jgi:Calcineurin-like phosphoesterase